MESWFSYVQFSNERFSKCIWDVPKVKDVQDQQLNVLEIIGDHRVANDIVVDTLCRLDVDPTVMERPIVHHVVDNFINDNDEQLSIQSGSSEMNNNK